MAALCLQQARAYAGSVAVFDEHETLTYAELAERARRVSGALTLCGVSAGDRVVVIGRNSVAWVSVAFGIMLAGCTVVPIGYANSERERRTVIANTAPALVVSEQEPATPHGQVSDGAGGRTISFAELLDVAAQATAQPTGEPAPIDPDSAALIMSTSGSTGVPKQVPMSHGQLVRLYADVATRLGLRSSDRLLCAVPLAHSFGFNGVLLGGLLAGAAVRLVEHYDRIGLGELMVQERLTAVLGPPTILFDLVHSGQPDVAAGCRMAVSGGSDVPLEQMRSACRQLGITQMFVGYGLTEACGTVALGEVADAADSALPLLRPVDDLTVVVVDDDGRPVPAGVDGHIRCRGRNVMSGYVGDPGATEDAIDPEGWLLTGDLGSLDAQGRLSIASRAKDTVIVSGFNVYPREVEHVLLEDEAVTEAAVVGIPDERQGQRLVACITTTPGHTLDADRLLEQCRASLTPYKVPRVLIELDALPTTATGKRSRAALQAYAIAHQSA